MKSIVVYFSMDGSTKLIAEKIQQIFHADLLEIKPKKKLFSNEHLRLYQIGWQVYAKRQPPLCEAVHDLSDYDKIFLGTPIWMGTMAPAIRTFLHEAQLEGKSVVPYCTYEDEIGHFFDELRSICPNTKISFGMGFKLPREEAIEELEESVRVWLNNMRT